MIQKVLPHAIIDRQTLTLTLDDEELPYYYAEIGPHTRPYAEGLSVVWVPILVSGVEDLPADETRRCDPALWASRPLDEAEIRLMGGRVLESYRGDS